MTAIESRKMFDELARLDFKRVHRGRGDDCHIYERQPEEQITLIVQLFPEGNHRASYMAGGRCDKYPSNFSSHLSLKNAVEAQHALAKYSLLLRAPACNCEQLRQDVARYENGRVVMIGEIERLKGVITELNRTIVDHDVLLSAAGKRVGELTSRSEPLASKELAMRAEQNARAVRDCVRNGSMIHATTRFADFLDEVAAALGAAHEPCRDAEAILEAYDAAWLEDEQLAMSASGTLPKGKAVGMRERFNAARAAVLAAMRPSPPPGALHQVAAIAGDTSYAAEDRIEKIQSLLSGVNPSPSPDARVVNGCRLGDQGDAVRGAEHDRSFASGRADNRTRPEPAAGRDRAAGHDVPAMDEECVVRGLHEGIDRSSSQIQPPGDACALLREIVHEYDQTHDGEVDEAGRARDWSAIPSELIQRARRLVP